MHTRWQRAANLLGVLALELAGRMTAATAEAVSMGAGAPAAIAALRLYAALLEAICGEHGTTVVCATHEPLVVASAHALVALT